MRPTPRLEVPLGAERSGVVVSHLTFGAGVLALWGTRRQRQGIAVHTGDMAQVWAGWREGREGGRGRMEGGRDTGSSRGREERERVKNEGKRE